jgi:hypothetical protein
MKTVYLNGRLGNQMFQYVIARATAERIGCNFFVPGTTEEATGLYSEMSRIFSVHLETFHPGNPHFWLGHGLFDVHLGSRDDIVTRIGDDSRPNGGADADGLFLHGYFQSEQHFAHIRPEVKRWFTVSDEVLHMANPVLEKYPVDSTCYIHFRGGDYKSIPHWYLPGQYYLDAMDLVRSRVPGIRFVVVTDDREEAASVLPGIESVSNDAHVDFCLLNKARWCIIPNSSFSWWACWLNDDSFVVAPHGWLNHNSGGPFNPSGIETARFNYIKKR